MIETITPAVCGGKNRHRLALSVFTATAVAASALVGAALAVAGAWVGARGAVLAAAAVAGLAAAREAGLVRLPLPQLRLQVPERWHAELPLPVWAAGYGAGLGVGVATYQPVATFWVASAAALALGRPVAAAVCFSLYGLGRAVMVIVPARREPDVTAVVERLARRRPAVRRANTVALAACAGLLTASPAAGAAPLALGPGSQLDPSVSAGVLAYAQRDAGGATVVVRVSKTESYPFSSGESPSLDGDLLAYADPSGVRVVRWRTGEEVARLAGAITKPALEWPWLAYRIDLADDRKRLVLRNLETGTTRLLTRANTRTDIGRASVDAGRVAWHRASGRGSRIVVYGIGSGRRTVLAASRIALVAYPSLSSLRVVWVEQRSGYSFLRLRRLDRRTVSTLASSASRDRLFWTTALAGRTAYVTRWVVSTGVAKIHSARF